MARITAAEFAWNESVPEEHRITPEAFETLCALHSCAVVWSRTPLAAKVYRSDGYYLGVFSLIKHPAYYARRIPALVEDPQYG